MAKRVLVALSTAPVALVGCHSSSSDDLPTAPPTSITQVASGGFSSPTDAVASPDGRTFYFAAYDDLKEPTIFKVRSEPGSRPEAIAVSDPLELPIGLVLSCDGSTLYVADMGGETGAVLALPTAGGAVSVLAISGIVRPSGLAMAADCKTLHASGRTEEGEPALFSMSIDGGSATVIYKGAPLESPTGLHVDDDGVSWLMDHRAAGAGGEGVLWAIPADGSAATEVIGDLRMGTTGGVSLTAGGGTAVMPTRDRDGNAQLTSVNITTGEMTQLAAPDMIDPSGLRTARKAGVFAVVDSEAGAIYRAE
jgi:DNA-binding beta-propeller fold protein YncE